MLDHSLDPNEISTSSASVGGSFRGLGIAVFVSIAIAILWAAALLNLFGDVLGHACLVAFVALAIFVWNQSSGRSAGQGGAR